MFKKAIAVLLLIALCASVFALDMSKAEPYGEDEFPKWELNLRRTEIIFFGTIPVAFPLTSIACSIANKDLDFWDKVGVSAGVAAGVAIADIIIGAVKQK